MLLVGMATEWLNKSFAASLNAHHCLAGVDADDNSCKHLGHRGGGPATDPCR